MIHVIYIILGLAALILIMWGGSEIFSRVFFRYGEKFLLNKSNKLKKKENDTEKK